MKEYYETCEGCLTELDIAYEMQLEGYAIELEWDKSIDGNKHCFFKAYTTDGEWVAG